MPLGLNVQGIDITLRVANVQKRQEEDLANPVPR